MPFMITRSNDLAKLRELILRHRVVGIVGSRQVGKTTLARMLCKHWDDPVSFFDAENPEDFARLADPMLALKNLRGLVVIDEIQRLPGLFTVLRVLADRDPQPARFLVLGSASPELLRQSSESLAGRIFYHEIGGLTLADVGMSRQETLWFRGGLPRSYLAANPIESHEWRQGYIRTFLEQDLPQLGVHIGADTMRRFWTMLAHYHGQTWNASEIARSFGVADTTVRGYLDRLTSCLVVTQLLPWHENISKRQVKTPKVYIRDSGILHALLNLRTPADVAGHPKMGASWEGFVLDQLIRHLGADREECFFWATHSGAELDLLVTRGSRRLGFEIKHTSAPRLTPSMRHAAHDLKLDSLTVIHAGSHLFPLADRIVAVPLQRMLDAINPLA
jgi:predicted AAA+ superfamily ATPase